MEFNTNIINSAISYECFKDIINDEMKKEFFGECGNQHYRLLSYISTLYNNSNIIDIGTHRGCSALALSYNKTNTIHTFDIVNNMRVSNDNIIFHKENLFEEPTRDKWKEIILNCPFIFLDVDPHNGHMEIDFYNYIKDINYKGFIICDDIWHFKEMRDNFWYKIPSIYKKDITEFGHWSGTGIINFNNNYNNNNYNWTLVTAYFNLTKYSDATSEINNRNQDYYMSHSISTLSLPYNLVIYCDIDTIDIIKKIRPVYLSNNTIYIIKEFDKFRFKKNNKYLNHDFAYYRQKITQNRIDKPYHFDNRNTPSYYLFCMSRYIMLKEIIELNPFKSTHFGWINFCIERMGIKNVMKLDEALAVKRDKFSTCYIDYIPPSLIENTSIYYKYGRCGMCSGFFTGNNIYMYKVCDLIENQFIQYIEEGYGHADEQLYSPVYFKNPELFEHYYGDYNQMITNYKYVYDNPESIINYFIKSSYDNNNYIKCYEACKYLFNSFCMNKCKMSDEYLTKLYYYYMNCKKKLYNII